MAGPFLALLGSTTIAMSFMIRFKMIQNLQYAIISALKFAVQVHLRPEFHAVEHRGCDFDPKDILPNVSQVL